MKIHLTFAAIALTAVAACDAPSAPDFVGTDVPITTPQALGFFQTVCINNAAALGNARQTLSGLPVIRNSTQDIYYHTDAFVSFKITPIAASQSVCSMVWDPVESNAQSLASFQNQNPETRLRDNQDGTLTAFFYGNP